MTLLTDASGRQVIVRDTRELHAELERGIGTLLSRPFLHSSHAARVVDGTRRIARRHASGRSNDAHVA